MPIIVDLSPAPGSSVDLQAIWLNDVTNPADVREFPFVGTYSRTSSKTGEVRTGASGRERAFTKAGTSKAAAIALVQCDPDDVAWLEDHKATLLCVRDDRGQKWFGIYFELPVDESVDYADRSDINLQIKSVTYSEAV